MVLDMANSDASSAILRVLFLFDLVATDNTSSSSSITSAIHKEKCNILLSGHEHDLFNFVKHLKTFTWLAEIAKTKSFGENPEVTIAISCYFITLMYKKLFLFCRNL